MQKGKKSNKLDKVPFMNDAAFTLYTDQRGHMMEYLQLLWEKMTRKTKSDDDDDASAREVMRAFQILVSPKAALTITEESEDTIEPSQNCNQVDPINP